MGIQLIAHLRLQGAIVLFFRRDPPNDKDITVVKGLAYLR